MARPVLSKREGAERVAAKIEAAPAVLAEQVAALQSGEDWTRFLGFQARLHQYSANNVMLIVAQHAQAHADGLVPTPEATYVAGFKTWQALGRSVDKGQHGYLVLAPTTGWRRVAVDEEGHVRELGRHEALQSGESEDGRKTLRGFKVEYVFELGQTSGAAVPEPVRPRLLEGEAPPGLGSAVTGSSRPEGSGWTPWRTPRRSAGRTGRPTGRPERWWCGRTWTTPRW
jgi:hypothetical protein